MRRYPEYRESGVEWIGGIPKAWSMVPLRRLAVFHGGGTPSKKNEAYWSGAIPWVSPKDMKSDVILDTEDHVSEAAIAQSSTKLVTAGAVLVVVRSGILRHSIPAALNAVPVALNQDMKAIVPNERLDARFLRYFIAGNQANLLTRWRKQGATVESIEHDFLANDPIPVPPLRDQNAIIDFLDRKTARIDTLIQKRQTLIDLLREQRTALIDRAVTKGLDPDVPMKDPGIEWLGEVPEQWSYSRFKFLYHTIEQGWSPACESRTADDGEWGVLKVGCVNGDDFNELEHKALPNSLQPRPELEIRAGDLLMSRANTRELVGSVSLVGDVRPRLLLCDKLYRIGLNHSVEARFMAHVLRSPLVRRQIQAVTSGASASMQNIRRRSLANCRFRCRRGPNSRKLLTQSTR